MASLVRAADHSPRRSLVAQLAAYLLMASISNGLRSLWPVYIGRLGGDPAFIGYYTALGTLAVTIGTVVTGWLADRLQRQRLLFLLACCLLTASLGLMSRATSLL
ncbi:MAG: hypothetical protein Q8O07_09785, partial [Chloroflexota bacterium]|nr:hypothetical protein [Chloroflexota bacterium]